MLRDLKSNADAVISLYPVVQAASANADASVDLLGYDSAMFLGLAGAIAGAGVFFFQPEESSDNITFTTVAVADLDGAFVAATLTNTVQRVGYKGSKRYVRLSVVKTSGTSVLMGGVVVRGNPERCPV